MYANSRYPDQTPHSAASDLGLHCLSMSHKKDVRLILVFNAHADVPSGAVGLLFGLILFLPSYFLHASSMGSCEYVLAWAFVN